MSSTCRSTWNVQILMFGCRWTCTPIFLLFLCLCMVEVWGVRLWFSSTIILLTTLLFSLSVTPLGEAMLHFQDFSVFLFPWPTLNHSRPPAPRPQTPFPPSLPLQTELNQTSLADCCIMWWWSRGVHVSSAAGGSLRGMFCNRVARVNRQRRLRKREAVWRPVPERRRRPRTSRTISISTHLWSDFQILS